MDQTQENILVEALKDWRDAGHSLEELIGEQQVLEIVLKDWLPTNEAMELSRRSEPWLRKLRKEKRVRAIMHGTRVLWYKPDLEALPPKSLRGRPKKAAREGIVE